MKSLLFAKMDDDLLIATNFPETIDPSIVTT